MNGEVSMYVRRSPIHDALSRLSPTWEEMAGLPVAQRFGNGEQEQAAAQDLALADVSALSKLGILGPGAATWLSEQGIEAPAGIYACSPLAGSSGRVIRLRADEIFIEQDDAGERVAELKQRLGAGLPGCRPVERQDAGLLLLGERYTQVLAQTCALDFRSPRLQLAMTRVAGVSCMALSLERWPGLRLWCEPDYAPYLWNTLLEIVQQLGGMPVGWQAVEALR